MVVGCVSINLHGYFTTRPNQVKRPGHRERFLRCRDMRPVQRVQSKDRIPGV